MAAAGVGSRRPRGKPRTRCSREQQAPSADFRAGGWPTAGDADAADGVRLQAGPVRTNVALCRPSYESSSGRRP